jgi:5-carboxymethyl-2-hydroxymuconate isomerase
MPHIIIEHSSDIVKSNIRIINSEILQIMKSITDGNFDIDQCKIRSFIFDEYRVGTLDESEASFIHITIKILSGRSVEIRKKLAELVFDFSKKSLINLPFKRNSVRTDLSVDIVEMDRETYQKTRIE